jgi:hypothetical protein
MKKKHQRWLLWGAIGVAVYGVAGVAAKYSQTGVTQGLLTYPADIGFWPYLLALNGDWQLAPGSSVTGTSGFGSGVGAAPFTPSTQPT